MARSTASSIVKDSRGSLGTELAGMSGGPRATLRACRMSGSDITSLNTSVGLLTDGAERGRCLSEYFGRLFKITSQILLGLIGL